MGCVEFAVPGKTLEDKLRALESRGMWLELANDGIDEARLKKILDTLSSFKCPIKSVQAYLQRRLHLLSADEKNRKAATRHVEETVKVASELGAQNVVAVVTYGEPTLKNPREKCIDTFRHLGKLAEEVGVIVSIEPLGKNRTKFLPSVSEVHRLVLEVGSPNVRLMADTMHIHDNGDDVVETVGRYASELAELQLRDTDSMPPGKGSIDFVSLLEIIRNFRGLVCLEYTPGPDPNVDFLIACDIVAKLISGAR